MVTIARRDISHCLQMRWNQCSPFQGTSLPRHIHLTTISPSSLFYLSSSLYIQTTLHILSIFTVNMTQDKPPVVCVL